MEVVKHGVVIICLGLRISLQSAEEGAVCSFLHVTLPTAIAIAIGATAGPSAIGASAAIA